MTVAVETVSFKKFPAANGLLCVCESGRSVPFDIRRVFLVSAGSGDIRGDHAHKTCTQLLVCVSGKIRVSCDDGTVVTHHLLEDICTGLLVPPGIWATEAYLTDAVLMAMCSQDYDADDYIRDYTEFKAFIGAGES